MQNRYFKTIEPSSQEQDNDFFITKEDDFSVSVLGDLHTKYYGSVVKAMARAKNIYQQVAEHLLSCKKGDAQPAEKFFKKMDEILISKVISVIRLTKSVIEVVIKSPLAAEEFSPGQFYRLQNYEVNAKVKKGCLLATEPLAMTGAWVDKAKGLISLIILEMGGSTNFCKYLKKGEIISLMGPTGKATYIPKNKKVILMGGGLGNAVLFSIGRAMKQNGCYVLYFAGYKDSQDVFKKEEIEKAANQVIWCCDKEKLPIQNENNLSFHGNIVDALQYYKNNVNKNGYRLEDFEHLIVIGSGEMMAAVAKSVHAKKIFRNDIKAIASFNSPMQCMMTEICAQCLQKHIDPLSGKEYYVYSCINQDQNIQKVDFSHLSLSLNRNSLLEKSFKSLDYYSK